MRNKNKPQRSFGKLQRMVRFFLPTYHYQVGYEKRPWKIEVWRGDERFRPSIHLHWNWRGLCRWLVIFLPCYVKSNAKHHRTE